MHYDTLYPGRFIKATTLERPMTIRIVSVTGEELEGDDGTKAKGVMRFRTAGANGKPVEMDMVLAKTNAILIAAVLGVDDIEKWAGHLVTICNDPKIMFGKERVGGIRVCGSPELKAPLRVEVKRPRRRQPEVYMLQPTDNQGRTRTAQAPVPPPAAAPEPDRQPGGEE